MKMHMIDLALLVVTGQNGRILDLRVISFFQTSRALEGVSC